MEQKATQFEVIKERAASALGGGTGNAVAELVMSALSFSLSSSPPSGKRKVTNIYFDPEVGKVVCEVDTEVKP